MSKIYIKPQIKWTQEKINLLKSEYPLGNKQELANKLGINRNALKSAAIRFGVKSMQDKNLYKLKLMYEDTPLAYYWMGFITADGYISKIGELKISLSIKDKSHLQKLADLLKVKLKSHFSSYEISKNKFEYCDLTCCDSKYGKLLMSKFNFISPKTYNPPLNLEIKDDKLFLSFFIGLIDGDGTFSKNKNGDCSFIRVEMHSSWTPFLEKLKKRLNQMNIGNVVIGKTKKNYSFIRIYKNKNLLFLKNFSSHHKLPVLDRKWNTVNKNKSSVLVTKKWDLPLDTNNFF